MDPRQPQGPYGQQSPQYRPTFPPPYLTSPEPPRGPWWRWRPRKPVEWLYVAGGVVAAGVVVAGGVAGAAGSAHKAGVSPSPSQAAAPAVSHSKKPKAASWPYSPVVATKAKLGADWPFGDGVTAGVVACDTVKPGAELFTPSDGPAGVQGREFAINGVALDAGYPDIPVRIRPLDKMLGGGARKSVGPVMDLEPNDCMTG